MTIFSKIIAGEIPSYRVAENENYFAFLDINPMAKGHVLVVPKQETDYIFDLDDAVLSGLAVFAKRVAEAIKAAIPCRRVGVLVLGMEVPHTHVHLIPLNQETDVDICKPKLKLAPDEFKAIADAIAEKFSAK
ncbi:MAG: HIT family protein [Dysgonamonadaceae bacterium]|jgi:histidine triad (HIT) family protein|nr:HIT family protein [Dysgonamonadaceae bacterium]